MSMSTSSTTLADELLLVLLDPESGKPRIDARLDFGLAGALLLELALAERIELSEAQPRKARVEVVDDRPLDDDLLTDALRRVAEKPRKAEALVPLLAKGLRGRLLERAEQRGDVRRERRFLARDRWPAADASRCTQLTARLHDVLVTGVTPDPRTGGIVALLAAIDAAPAAVAAPDRPTRKAVARRAAEIGEGAWAAESVRRAVKAAQAAVASSAAAAALAASTAATTAGSS